MMKMKRKPRVPRKGPITAIVEATVKAFSPQRALQRSAARAILDQGPEFFLGGYQGGKITRTTDNWNPTDYLADEALLQDLKKLRSRSEDLVRNSSDASGVITTFIANVISTGIRPQSRVNEKALGISQEEADAFQEAAEHAWENWVPYADAKDILDFYEIQAQTERSMLVAGEAFLLRRMIDGVRPYSLALEMIDPSRVDTPTDMQGKGIRSGIELDGSGQPIAIWVQQINWKDPKKPRKLSSEGFTRIPIWDEETGLRNVLHLYYQERPGQSRGIPMFAPVLDLLNHVEGYVEAEVVAARVAACVALFITTQNPYGMATANATSHNDDAERLERMRPGIIQYLLPGQDMKSFSVDRPGGQFEPFLQAMMRRFGSAWGLPYELISKDFSKTNYSSARAGLLQAYRVFRYRQAWLGRKLCQNVWEWLLQEAFLRGQLGDIDYMEQAQEWNRAAWITPGWEWVDPLKEAQAAKVSMENYLSALADESASRGKNWEQTLEQQAREQAKREELGLPQPGVKPVAASGSQGLSDVDLMGLIARRWEESLNRMKTEGQGEG